MAAPINLPSEPPSNEFERQMLEFARQAKAAIEEANSR